MANVSPSNAELYCMPGDITVTRIPTGYLLGRNLERQGPAPWWTYILIVSEESEARTIALDLARSAGTRAWFHLSGDLYEPIAPEPADEHSQMIDLSEASLPFDGLPLRCGHCGAAVTVEYDTAPYLDGVTQEWICPVCSKSTAIRLRGIVRNVAAGHRRQPR